MAARPPDSPGTDPAPTERQPAIDDTGRIDQTRHLPQAPAGQPVQPSRPPVASSPPAPQPVRPQPRTAAAVSRPAVPPPYLPQQAVPRSSAVPRRSPATSGWYLPWWSLVVLVLAVGAIAFILVIILAEFSAPNTPGNQPAQVRVITSMPTLSQDFFDTSSRNIAPTAAAPINAPASGQVDIPPLPTAAPSPSLPPGDFRIGATVRVVGVGVNGLNVRSDPGTGSTARFLAFDDDEFVVVDGPQNVNNLEWWRIEDPNDDNRYGWAARNYLEVVEP